MESNLRRWMLSTTYPERCKVAALAGVRYNYLRRLSRREIKDPGLYTVRRIIQAIRQHNTLQLDGRLPDVTLDDV